MGGEMKQLTMTLAFLVAAAFAPLHSSSAQARGDKGKPPTIPQESRPPAGMCRIWLDDVPAGQQPAPTDCASAVRNRPANGRVLFGDEPPKTKKGKSDKGKSSSTDGLIDLITRRI